MNDTTFDLPSLLGLLEKCPASSLENQRLDFKQWNVGSTADSVKMIVSAAVCMANGGGGQIVVGVNDKARGRAEAILGVPSGVDSQQLAESIACKTSPRLSVDVAEVHVEFGTGRLLALTVPGCYTTTTDGQSWKRHGDKCLPMTPEMVINHLESMGTVDFLASKVPAGIDEVVSAAAMEQLREFASREAPADLLSQSDARLLASLGVLQQGRPTLACLLLAGREDAIREFLPSYKWTFLRMRSETDYSDRADGAEALPLAMQRVADRIMVDNPIDTVEYGLLHFEYRKFPELAIREALLNAFGHADYRVPSPITVEQRSDRLVISNPGAFVGGVSPSNILRHASVSRNPILMEALLRLRLVNRVHLGVRRIYEAMLIEGKEPPIWDEVGNTVRVLVMGQRMSASFREFVTTESETGRALDLEDMILLRHLTQHAEVTTATAVKLTQECADEIRARLNRLAIERGYLARGGTGKGTYWRLRRETHERLAGAGMPDRDNRVDWATARAQVAAALSQRSRRSEPGLTNAEIRQISGYDRSQVTRLMAELRAEGVVVLEGHGRGARYYHTRHPK